MRHTINISKNCHCKHLIRRACVHLCVMSLFEGQLELQIIKIDKSLLHNDRTLLRSRLYFLRIIVRMLSTFTKFDSN